MKANRFGSATLLFLISACSSEWNATEPATTVEEAVAGPQVGYVTTGSFDAEVMQSEIPVLVDFTAEWCVPCREVDPIIMDLYPEMYGRAKVYKLDIDNDPEIYRQLGVNGVPHILFFDNGQEQGRIASPQPREVYVDYLEALVDGRSTLDVSLKLLEDDAFRRHFLLSQRVEDLQKAVDRYPTLLNDPMENGQTPLSIYLNRGGYFRDQQVELALANGAVPTVRDLVGLDQCDEFLAAAAEDPELLHRPDADGATPLYLAMVRSGRLDNSDCVHALLDAGADPAAHPNQLYSVSNQAVFRGESDPELLVRLLELGLDPELENARGENMLHMAAHYSYTNVVRILVEHGVDRQATNADGETAAEVAMESIARFEEALNNGINSKGLEISEWEGEYYREQVAKKQVILQILGG